MYFRYIQHDYSADYYLFLYHYLNVLYIRYIA